MTKQDAAENLKLLDARLQRDDEDRWLSSRYAPLQARQKLIALYALNLELAKVRTIVSEPGLGAIRFQWWRDALGELEHGRPPRKHDVVLAVSNQALAIEAGLQLIEGHEAAFEANDRGQEPEGILMQTAASLLVPGQTWEPHIKELAPAYAAARRGETSDEHPGEPLVVPTVPTPLRPAICHAVLRGAYQYGKRPGPLRKRFAIMRAMLTGKI